MRVELRRPIEEHIFGGFDLRTDSERFQKRVVLSHPNSGKNLPYLVWSAGQREFVPLLLGFYWLMPPGRVSKRNSLGWVVIEELEMGLHPNAISVVLLQIVELLRRGYRICLSTHSPHVLDVVWGLKVIQERGGTHRDVLKLFSLRPSNTSNDLAKNALNKKLKVHYFTREGGVQDISRLDPGSDNESESGWGGLSEFSGNVGDIVADVVSRAGIGTGQ